MPDCLIKTIESVRKKKLEHWQRNAETNRAWLALNMMTEAQRGLPRVQRRPGRTPRSGLHRAAPAARARRDVGRRYVPRHRVQCRPPCRGRRMSGLRVEHAVDGARGAAGHRPPEGNVITLGRDRRAARGARGHSARRRVKLIPIEGAGPVTSASGPAWRSTSLTASRACCPTDAAVLRSARGPGADARGRARPVSRRRIRDRAGVRFGVRRRQRRSSACRKWPSACFRPPRRPSCPCVSARRGRPARSSAARFSRLRGGRQPGCRSRRAPDELEAEADGWFASHSHRGPRRRWGTRREAARTALLRTLPLLLGDLEQQYLDRLMHTTTPRGYRRLHGADARRSGANA